MNVTNLDNGEQKFVDGNPFYLILAPDITLPLVRVPAGDFLMGSSDHDPTGRPEEYPRRKVYLDEFLIGKYEVTVAQFRAFVQVSGYKAESKALRFGKDDHPVNNVNWDDAMAFCRWASHVTERTVRLPTEAEWEKAARGTDGRIYPWGMNPPDRKLYIWYYGANNTRDTMPVGTYSPSMDSPFGCADMAGNVWEWMSDWFIEYDSTRSGGIPLDPDQDGGKRVLRGGSRYYNTDFVRCASRGWIRPDIHLDLIGFRCAVSPGA